MKKHLRHVILWLFDKNNEITGTDVANEIREVYGQDAITEQACRKWLRKFRAGDKNVEDLEDEPRSGRPSNFDDEELRRLVEEDPKRTIRELVVLLDSSYGSVQCHLHSIGLVSFCFKGGGG